MKALILECKYLLGILLLVVILSLTNYTPGTYLSGWDNLQTELNPGLAVKRAFFSVWQEYQSFGLTAGMAHAADLVRASFLWLMSFFIPQNIIRYFYHFLMLFLGGLGMLKLLENFGFVGIFGFLGAVFYMLNLGTVQIFYLPFEPFSTFFAFLPWGILTFIKMIRDFRNIEERKKNLIIFFLINLLGTPAFYVQQLFVVYIIVLFSIFLGVLLYNNSRAAASKLLLKGVLLFFIIFIINSFWLLPQIYFLKTNRRVVTEAKANQIATKDVFYQNYEKGTINNFLILEGFYFDLKGINRTFLFIPWKDHFNKPIIGLLPYLFGGLMILGILESLIKKKNLEFIFIFLVCANALLLATPPFSWINELLRKILILDQIFRSPFTKLIVPYSLVYSYFFIQGIKIFTKSVFRDNKRFLIGLFMFSLIIVYSLPVFQGFFFSSEMKIKIPYDYQYLINYFKKEDKNKRIALLPDYTFWGWFFNKWGYNGSGFLWYGIEQPIISRTFDVWSKTSESYFWEIKTAFEAEDIKKIKNVFEKYQINYLILDKSLIPVVSNYKALQYDRINKLLMQDSAIIQIFSGENLSLYRINNEYYISKKFISLNSNLINISPRINITNDDQAFFENGFYKNDLNSKYDIYYPFLDLTTQTNLKEKNWQITEDDNYFYLSTFLPINTADFNFYFNSVYKEIILINDEPINVSLKIEPLIKNNKLVIRIEKKIIKNFNTNINQKTDFGFFDPTLSQNIGYLIKTQSVNNQGLPLFFYIIDETKKQAYLEERLNNESNYFILPPRYKYGIGYTFAFQNKSFKNLTASNNLKKLTLYFFPYQILKEMKFVRKGFNQSQINFFNNYKVKKNNYFIYKIQLNDITTKQAANVILFQSYDSGWLAFANGKKLEHILINNWANGWKLPDDLPANTKIVIIFWPQYLQFLGFGLLGLTVIFLIKYNYQPKKEETN